MVGTAVVAFHAAVVLLHGRAHAALDVRLPTWQVLYAGIVIDAAPLLAAGLLWSRHRRPGGHLLWTSMAGALAFGVYHHFIAISPDHLSHLPPGEAQALFRWTAVLLPVSEAAGLLLGVRAARRFATTGPMP